MYRHYLKSVSVIAALLLLSAAASGQQALQSVITGRFRSYQEKIIREKLFLHTDREFYVAGEILWFRVYYAEGGSHRPLQLSKVAYVEVLDGQNKAVLQAIVSLKPGEEHGSFYLPVSLSTGYYKVRAYTNWMKNFDETDFFTKTIAIVNTLKNPEPPAPAPAEKTSIHFFPEGGDLVNNVQSRVGFYVSDNKGSIDAYKGFVVDQQGDTVASFSPLKFGIGHFSFRPVTGHTYRASVILPDQHVITYDLPAAHEEGYTMKVTTQQQGQVLVTVYRRRMAGEQNTEPVLLAAHTRQQLHVAEQAFISNNDSAVFAIDRAKLGSGVVHFTIFAGNSRPVCERLLFIKPPAGASLSVHTDRAVYTNRARIGLSLQTSGNAALSLSAAVFRVDSLQQADESVITDYLWLLSELPGPVQSPRYYFSDDPDAAAATDNLMLTHGWRRFNWDRLSASPDTMIRYLPEVNGHLVTGLVTDLRTGRPAVNIPASLSVAGSPFGFYTARSDASGRVFFEVKDYYGQAPVIVRAGTGTDSSFRITISSPYAGATGHRGNDYTLPDHTERQLLQKSIGMQAQNIYRADSLRHFSVFLPADTLPFYGKADVTYRLDDYKRFATMEEVLREYVSQAGVAKRNGRLVFRLFDPAMHDFYEGESLVLVDGVALRDASHVFALDPLKIKKLDIVQNRFIAGQSVFNGIASFTTYGGNFDAAGLDAKLVSIDYEGLQLRREFYSPSYAMPDQLQNRVPDFRNTLFWHPDIATGGAGNASLEFYSPDQPGRFVVIVQGLSANGEPVFASTVFEVQDKH